MSRLLSVISARRHRRGEARDRGSVTIEAVILAPAFMLFVALIFMAGRMTIAQQSVESAANAAARSASIERSAGAADGAARSAATSTLNNQGLTCVSTSVVVDTSGFSVPVGTPAEVEARVSCAVKLSDLGLPGVPGSRTVTATVVSPLDTYRGR